MTTTKTVLSTSDSNLDSVLNLPLPFELIPGRYVIVKWKSTEKKRLSINFTDLEDGTQRKNVLIHFNPRFDMNVLVRNAMVERGWGAEEKDGGMPFQLGVLAETKIVTRADFFECFVDGVKHSEFRHRLPLEIAKHFCIKGDCEIESVVFGDEATEQDAAADLSTPYETPCEISPGRKIHVSGTPDAGVNKFWVFLREDDDYAFVLVVKMKRKTVAMNSRIKRDWKAKQRVKEFPFEVDQPFNILIEVEADKFKVSVNDKPLADFIHRVLPLSRINKVRVDEKGGKLALWRVHVE